jgi:hypothetical protein
MSTWPGSDGERAAEAIAHGVVPFGYHEIAHELCMAGDWSAAREVLRQAGRSSSGR